MHVRALTSSAPSAKLLAFDTPNTKKKKKKKTTSLDMLKSKFFCNMLHYHSTNYEQKQILT